MLFVSVCGNFVRGSGYFELQWAKRNFRVSMVPPFQIHVPRSISRLCIYFVPTRRRLRELEQTLKKVSERVQNIPDASGVNGTGSSSNHARQVSQTRVLTPNSSTTGTKRMADVLSDSGSASEAIDTQCLRRRRRSTHGSSSLQSYVTGDGKKAHHFFGSTSEMVFLDNVREYVQQLGYELPSSRALWSPSLETVPQGAVQSNLSAELRSQLPPQPLGAKLLEVYRNSVQAHTPMLYWPSILIKFQRIYTGSPVHYEHDQIVADFSILMMVWAVGAQMSDLAEVRHNSGRQMKNGWQFFEAARRYHGGRLIKARYTLDDAIISLLISVYLMGASLPSPCWVMTGITSRIVQDLGLHKRPSPHQLFNVEIESRNRLFWGAYIVDRVVALTCGRPVSLLDEDCDVDLPKEIDSKVTTARESLDFFRASISVVVNLDAIIQFGAISHYEVSDMETMKKIDAQLFACWQQYPGGLCDPSETSPIEPSTLKLVFVGQQASRPALLFSAAISRTAPSLGPCAASASRKASRLPPSPQASCTASPAQRSGKTSSPTAVTTWSARILSVLELSCCLRIGCARWLPKTACIMVITTPPTPRLPPWHSTSLYCGAAYGPLPRGTFPQRSPLKFCTSSPTR